MFDFITGSALLLLFLCIIGVGYHKFMQSMYRDIAEEDAEEIADRKFYEACKNAEIRVKQQLVIVDEMGR